LTAEQKKQLEDQLAEERRRQEIEKLDNWRDRGLMEMMGGVLQIRREDELKKVTKKQKITKIGKQNRDYFKIFFRTFQSQALLLLSKEKNGQQMRLSNTKFTSKK
jgi:hypothetical protein